MSPEMSLLSYKATQSEPQKGAAADSIHAHLEKPTARTGPISGKLIHTHAPDPPSKSVPIPPRIFPVPSHLQPDPLIFYILLGNLVVYSI